ncbi:MAG: hypothetical protein HY907_04375 [Deltaproteobacteria bacterium]|nr:hypothetical protein [Deltaproteobacteria bacterium]
MTQPKPKNIVPTAALLAYGAVVAAPLGVLFARVALEHHTPHETTTLPPTTAAAPSPPSPPGMQVEGLPPFDAYGPDEAPPFPDLLLASVDGETPQRLSALHNGPTVVHLWSFACETCADEWPVQRAFVAEHTGPGREFPTVVSILVVPDSAGKPGEAGRAQVESARSQGWFGRPVPDIAVSWAVAEEDVLADGGGTPTAERPITGYPETFLLDGRGHTRVRLIGPVTWDLPTWRRLMAMLPDLNPAGSAAPMPPGHPPLPVAQPGS